MAIQIAQLPISDMMDIVNLGHFANKYMIAPWVEWSQTAILRFFRDTLNRTRVSKVEALKSALIVARDTHHDILWHAIPEAWQARLEVKSRQWDGVRCTVLRGGDRRGIEDDVEVFRRGQYWENERRA
jgi:hypothetical protein